MSSQVRGHVEEVVDVTYEQGQHGQSRASGHWSQKSAAAGPQMAWDSIESGRGYDGNKMERTPIPWAGR